MGDMPRVIHACKTTIDQGNGFSIEYRDWWPIKIHEAATSYTRTDLVDELIEVVRDKTIANVAFMAGEGTHEEFTVTSKRVVAAIAAITGRG